MKTIKALLIFIAGIFMLLTCTQADIFSDEDNLTTTLRKSNDKVVLVTVPFKANFSVWDHSDYTDPSCGEGWFNLTMEGYGNITHLGKMSTIMKFCLNPADGHYVAVDGTFVAANGDELYFEVIEGWVVPIDGGELLYYQTQFDDPINFLGGTGRFEGASGTATTNAFVHSIPANEWRTDFFSQGTLILRKGKK